MVAREESPDTGSQRPRAAAFARAWRRMLGALFSSAGKAATEGRSVVTDGLAGPAADGDRDRAGARGAAALGAIALTAGAAGRVALAYSARVAVSAAAVGALTTLVWAAARYVVMTVLRSRPPVVGSSAVARAWGRGALTYMLALTGWLHLAALVAAAAVTYRSLVGQDVAPRRAAALCAWGYGGELLALLATWFVTNGLIVLPFLG